MKVKKDLIKRSRGAVQLLIVLIILALVLGLAFYFYTQYKSSGNGASTREAQTEGKALPLVDAVGTKDLDIVGRYPGSVRTAMENVPDLNYTSVSYVTKDPLEKVKQYYLEQLQERGWELLSSEEDQLNFEKDPSTLGVHFYYDEVDKILKYTLEYTLDTNY